MEKQNRGGKIYLDTESTKESWVNSFLGCRDGIVEVYEYTDDSGWGSKTRLFLCRNTKHESVCIIRQTWSQYSKEWTEEVMDFDSDSFVFLEALITGNKNAPGGIYNIVRDYTETPEKP